MKKIVILVLGCVFMHTCRLCPMEEPVIELVSLQELEREIEYAKTAVNESKMHLDDLNQILFEKHNALRSGQVQMTREIAVAMQALINQRRTAQATYQEKKNLYDILKRRKEELEAQRQ